MGNDKGLRMTLCQRGERHGFAEAIFAEARQHDSFIVKKAAPITTEEYPTPSKRPANSALDCSLIEERFGIRTKPWHESLTRAMPLLLSNNGCEQITHVQKEKHDA